MCVDAAAAAPRILRGGCRVFGWCRVVSGGVGCCRVGVWCCRAWSCQVRVKGCRGCRSVRMCTRLQVLSVLSGCRAVGFRVLSGGVGLSGLCRGEQPYFVVSACTKVSPFHPDNSKQSVEESNPNMHTLKYMRLKISLTPRSSVRLRPFKARNWPKKAL